MNDDMPWVIGLTDEEVQELRSKKQELTQYGKEKIRELMTHEEMLEEAARRELANKSFEELTKEERIKLALEEVDWIVIGGQDGQEFYSSIQFLRKVLRSLR